MIQQLLAGCAGGPIQFGVHIVHAEITPFLIRKRRVCYRRILLGKHQVVSRDLIEIASTRLCAAPGDSTLPCRISLLSCPEGRICSQRDGDACSDQPSGLVGQRRQGQQLCSVRIRTRVFSFP